MSNLRAMLRAVNPSCFTLGSIAYNIGVAILVLAAIIVYYVTDSQLTAFILAVIGLIPLAGMIGNATEELGEHLGSTIGGILSASFGNAPELIFNIVCLLKNQDDILKLTLTGSIVSNILMVLGSSLLVGGAKNGIQQFQKGIVHNLASTALFLSAIYLALPTLLNQSLTYSYTSAMADRVEIISSVLMMIIYGGFTLFQLKYNPETPAAVERVASFRQARKTKQDPSGEPRPSSMVNDITSPLNQEDDLVSLRGIITEMPPIAPVPTPPTSPCETKTICRCMRIMHLQILYQLLVLFGSSVVVALLSEVITNTVDNFSTQAGFNQQFISFIIIAITGNAAEHWTAVKACYDNESDLAITTVLTSGLQISMFIVPLLKLLSYARSTPLSLVFTPIEPIILLASVIFVWFVVSDNKTNWVEGLMLFSFYIIIAAVYFVVF